MNKKVFLVEDANDMREALVELFDDVGGFEVVGTAATESAATQWLQQHLGGWDLLVLDLIIAEGSGFAVLARAKEADIAGRVVVLSEFATPAIAERCIRMGADRAFRKSELQHLVEYMEAVKRG